MGRKAFMADLAAVTQSFIPSISNIVRGAEDGEIEFNFTPVSGAEPIVVTIISADVSEYPGAGNPYFLSTSSHAAPEAVNRALETHAETSLGMTIEQLICSLASAFRQAYASGARNDPISLDDEGDTQMDDVSESDQEEYEEEDEDDEYEYGNPYDQEDLSDDGFETGSHRMDSKTAAKVNARIRQDLQMIKQAGFRVGVLTGLTADSDTSLLSISIRVHNLGLSDEAMQAWDLKAQQYAVLLIRYSHGYKTFEFIMDHGISREIHGLEFRVGLCKKYKPTVAEGIAAFSEAKRAEKNKDSPTHHQNLAGFSSMFISGSLNDFMNTQFLSLIKYRKKFGVNWDGAKFLLNRQQGTSCEETPNHLPDEYFADDIPQNKVLPAIAQVDHLRGALSEPSLPLISMQFFMRHFLRCPEFCLICHDKTTETFEALKPYVCSRGLCLFQYMQLGFGPSIEHEIITQPYVVDLLISFCYAAAVSCRLRSYPLGQHIFVPPRDKACLVRQINYPTYYNGPALPPPQPEQTPEKQPRFWNVKFDALKHEIIFEDPQAAKSDFNLHEWVVISALSGEPVHYRIISTSVFPTIQLSETGISRNLAPRVTEQLYGKKPVALTTNTPATTPPASDLVSAQLSKYEHDFDTLPDHEKASSIAMLLETLPKVTEMRDYLTQSSVKEPRLSNWTDHITQPALTLLRWIISSNRSIICQVNSIPGQTIEDAINSGVRLDDRVTGMDNMIQFRFAQGAPDKEQKFVDSLTKMKGKLNPNYPTLFAWHGSAMHNWHSIIRAGLDYSQTVNGRAYGNGCYFSQDFNTSAGYSSFRAEEIIWPGSVLQLTTAMAMAEIVNAPDEFTSKTPHLVVPHVDWIQCRYLFVNKSLQISSQDPSGAPQSSASTTGTSEITYIDQDPQYRIRNSIGEVIGIPTHAIASRKTLSHKGSASSINGLSSAPQPAKKKRKFIITLTFSRKEGKEMPDLPQDGYETDLTDFDDQQFLAQPDEPTELMNSPSGKRKATLTPEVKTDFVPGTLDPSLLQLMADPSYATSMASLQLSRALKSALKTQRETPLHELGWSIDERFTENLYQWIIELHSFEASLPLAQDMKKAEVTSVVLEMRFGKNFPISPPFVRVIRPRFVPFANRGGGHVTAGGALCMELLTNSGWSAVNTIESILMQVRLAMSSLEPFPARLENTNKHAQSEYRVGEAMDAFIRACNTHGWEVPSDFKELQAGVGGSRYD